MLMPQLTVAAGIAGGPVETAAPRPDPAGLACKGGSRTVTKISTMMTTLMLLLSMVARPRALGALLPPQRRRQPQHLPIGATLGAAALTSLLAAMGPALPPPTARLMSGEAESLAGLDKVFLLRMAQPLRQRAIPATV